MNFAPAAGKDIAGEEGLIMEQLPLVPMDTPATYRICVLGGLESSYAERLWGMTSTSVAQAGEPQQTALVGEVADQAALVGVINALYNAGHTVISVERIPPGSTLRMDNTDKEA